MTNYDYSFEACLKSVKDHVENYGENPFEELGRSIIRAKQDMFFNKTMIDAYEYYIEQNCLRWDEKFDK